MRYKCCLRVSSPVFNFQFSNLLGGGTREISGVDDRHDFGVTRDAFKLAGFSDADMTDAFRILAAILHLGDVEFVAGWCFSMNFGGP